MTDEIKKPVFKAPQIPMHAPAMPQAPVVGATVKSQAPAAGAKPQVTGAASKAQAAQSQMAQSQAAQPQAPVKPASTKPVPATAPVATANIAAQTTFEGAQASNASAAGQAPNASAATTVSRTAAQTQAATQNAADEKGKNFVKDLNLPPKIMETKVMAAVVAGIMVFGMMMGCMMFGGDETRVVQGLTDVVINPDIQKNLWRCGQIDPNRECVLYIMNAKTYDRLGSDFFQEAQNITGVPKYSIQMINVRYANVLIRPGYIAQIYIPARK